MTNRFNLDLGRKKKTFENKSEYNWDQGTRIPEIVVNV